MTADISARTDADIDALIAAATPGPWEIYRYRTGGGRIHVSGDDGRKRELVARRGLPPINRGRGRPRTVHRPATPAPTPPAPMRVLIEQQLARGNSVSWIMNALDVDYAAVKTVRDAMAAASLGETA